MNNYIYSEKDGLVQLVGQEDFHEPLARNKGDAFREYRSQWDAAGQFELETPVPLHVDFELSTSCNFKCPACSLSLPPEERIGPKGQFPFDLFKKVLDEAVPLGLKAIDLSYLNEPLLRRDIIDFIEYADKKGVLDIFFSSNASLLTPEWTEKLLDTGLTRFMVSLDASTEATFNKMRVGGDFKQVVRNLEYFLRKKKERGQTLPITRVSFLKTALNEGELDDFITHWVRLVDYISVQELAVYDFLPEEFIPGDRLRETEFQCHHPWHRVTILVNGDVMPCPSGHGRHLIGGNLNEQSLSEIWNGQKFRDLRRVHGDMRYYDNPVCKACVEESKLIISPLSISSN